MVLAAEWSGDFFDIAGGDPQKPLQQKLTKERNFIRKATDFRGGVKLEFGHCGRVPPIPTKGSISSGKLRRESAETKPERVIAEEFQRLGWTQADIARRHPSDPEELALVARLRAETPRTRTRIAARLLSGTRTSAHVRLQNRQQAMVPKLLRNVSV